MENSDTQERLKQYLDFLDRTMYRGGEKDIGSTARMWLQTAKLKLYELFPELRPPHLRGGEGQLASRCEEPSQIVKVKLGPRIQGPNCDFET